MIVNANAIFVYFAQQIDPAYSSGRFQDAIGRIYFIERQPAAADPAAGLVRRRGGRRHPGGLAHVRPRDGALYASTETGAIPVEGAVV
jgi:hypothetical protein